MRPGRNYEIERDGQNKVSKYILQKLHGYMTNEQISIHGTPKKK